MHGVMDCGRWSRATQDPSVPAGLRNLGNTCYVNTALQCLFSIPAFRQALIRATCGDLRPPAASEPSTTCLAPAAPARGRGKGRGGNRKPSPSTSANADVVEEVKPSDNQAASSSASSSSLVSDPVAIQLRDLFLDLQYGPGKDADPTAFAACLQLDHGVQQVGFQGFRQTGCMISRGSEVKGVLSLSLSLDLLAPPLSFHTQDCQEFFKLLLTKLEAVFSHVPEKSIQQAVQSLFRGRYSYVTTCRRCGRQSEGSAKRHDFYELQVQVKGHSLLASSMVRREGQEGRVAP